MTTDTVGGVWTYALALARALEPYDVEVLLAAKGRLTPGQERAAASIGNVTVLVGDYKLEWMDEPWEDVREAGEWLLGLADALQPDLIHLNDYCHAALSWAAPVVVVGHSCVLSWFEAVRGERPGPEWDPYWNAVCAGLRGADLVIAPSRHMLQRLAHHYGPFRRSQVIPNGCDARGFRTGDKQKFIFSAGRFWDEAKNLTTLAAAAPRVDWPVRVAGMPHPDGEDDPVTTREVEWLGRLDAARMSATYAEAAVYVLPAVYEPFGLSILEAALSGCALVLGDIPSLRENWSEAAIFVPPRDVDALTEAVNRLCREDSLRKNLACRATERASRLTAGRMGASYHQVYRRLLQSAPVHAVA